MDFKAEGMGQAFVSPYEFLSAGLYNRAIGDISNGNEKGIATDRAGVSAVVFENLDFGEYGSDEITIPVFALDNDLHNIELWLGVPGEDGAELVDVLPYQKPSIWNVYQEDTWKLEKRIKGVVTLSLQLHEKVHIKGFAFKKYEKAYSLLNAAECSKVYGDTFTVEEAAIVGIGNNVTVVFDNMNFGEQGAKGILLTGRSKLAGNTIHVLFTPENGEPVRRVLEVKGTEEYEVQEFGFEPLVGAGKIEFVFLPGSDFDMKSFIFIK
jgi:beta-galactosidase